MKTRITVLTIVFLVVVCGLVTNPTEKQHIASALGGSESKSMVDVALADAAAEWLTVMTDYHNLVIASYVTEPDKDGDILISVGAFGYTHSFIKP